MMYIMGVNSLALILVTLFGGLIFSALEAPNVRDIPSSQPFPVWLAPAVCFPDSHREVSRWTVTENATRSPSHPAPQQQLVQNEYAAFMQTLQAQLSMVPNGNATYATLIGNYMDDPTQMQDFWGPTQHTLYLFAFTIVTTIGYGSFAPKTSPGQIFCIVYILVRWRRRLCRSFSCHMLPASCAGAGTSPHFRHLCQLPRVLAAFSLSLADRCPAGRGLPRQSCRDAS